MDRRNSTKRFLSYFALLLIIILLLWIVTPSHVIRNNWLVMVTFSINGVLWTCLLLYEVSKHPYSFSVIHWTFFLLFFFFAAIVQYMNNEFPWIDYRSDSVLIRANLILTLWTFGVIVGQNTRTLMANRKSRLKEKLTSRIECNHIMATVAIAMIIALVRVKTIGLSNLLSRGTSSYSVSGNGAISMLIEKCMQATSYFSTAIIVLAHKKRKCGLGAMIASMGCLLIAYPPTGIARYAAAAIYLGILLTYSEKLKKENIFIFILIGAFSFVLPVLNAFRNLAFNEVDLFETLKDITDNFSTMWLAGDYDAYTMLTLTVDHATTNGITWMRQFVGVLFFWVPRAIWKNKPVGSGYFVADQLGWTFKNLSCPLPGEAYINLGIVGVFFFAFVIGKIMKFLDSCYWYQNNKDDGQISVLYPITMIMFFFMCRGDLLSSTAYMVAYTVVGFIMCSINKSDFNRKI